MLILYDSSLSKSESKENTVILINMSIGKTQRSLIFNYVKKRKALIGCVAVGAPVA